MKRSKFSKAQVAFILRQVDEGTTVGEACRKSGISDATFYVWRKKYAGLMPSEIKWLRQLEDENARLKYVVADLPFDKDKLQDVIKRKPYGLPVAASSWTISGRPGTRSSISHGTSRPSVVANGPMALDQCRLGFTGSPPITVTSCMIRSRTRCPQRRHVQRPRSGVSRPHRHVSRPNRFRGSCGDASRFILAPMPALAIRSRRNRKAEKSSIANPTESKMVT